MSGTAFETSNEPNTLQVQPKGQRGLTVVADGSWSQTRPVVDNYMRRLGGSGIEVVGDITAHSGQNPFNTSAFSGFSVDIVLDPEVLRSREFSPVRALLEGVRKDLGLKGIRADFSEASIYRQVIAVTDLKPQEYEAAFGLDKDEIDRKIAQNKERIRRHEIEDAFGFMSAMGEARIYKGDEANAARGRYTELDTQPLTRDEATRRANDGGVIVTHTRKGVYVSMGSNYGIGGDTQAEMHEIQESQSRRQKAIDNGLNVLDDGDNQAPRTNLRNSVTIRLKSHGDCEALAELLKTKGLTDQKLAEVRDAVPPNAWDHAVGAVRGLVSRLSAGASPKLDRA